MNPYHTCPVYNTNNFQLRLVTLADAQDLLVCYSDINAVNKMNTDRCTSDFYFATETQMKDCITFWLSEYEKQAFVRFAIVSKDLGKAVGTIEMFGSDFEELGHAGILRIDLASAYEKPEVLTELIALTIGSLLSDFRVDTILIRAEHTPERAKVLDTFGFTPTDAFRPGLGYYVYKHKGIAYCGLACCVCSENKSCPGCQAGGCEKHGWCKHYNCCREKGLSGCWECEQFPCDGGMFGKPRIRTFARFAKENGTEELVRCLMKNKAKGIVYHYQGQLVGDYDQCATENEIEAMLKT